jgi:lysophospholipase L1-like esterase
VWIFDGGVLRLGSDPSAPPPPPEPPPPPRVVFLGDSYTDARPPDGLGPCGYVARIGRALTVETVNNGAAGCGYVDLGSDVTLPYEATVGTVDGAQLVVVFGSINDRPHPPLAVRLAATVTYAAIRRWAPAAPLLIIGPQYPNEDVPGWLWPLRDAVRAAAREAGAVFVDPLAERWFAGRPELIGPDGLHPNTRGHAYLAELIAPHIAALLTREATT